MERDVPPGYEPYGQQGIKLIDPTDCPGGHAFAFGQRWYAACAEHHGHPAWRCACRVEQFLAKDGAIVASLECVSRG